MKAKKIKILFLCISLILVFNESGFCLFRDDVDPQQVRSRLSLQRQKDEPRKQMEQIKTEQEESLKEQNVQTISGAVPGATEKPLQEISGELSPSEPAKLTAQNESGEFKRLARDKQSSAGNSQTKTQPHSVESKARETQKNSSSNAWILLMIVLIAGFFIIRKKQE
ncbi:MAG: hypothetical protein ABIG64_06585 [Candidatus Omnitrophota bacterium]